MLRVIPIPSIPLHGPTLEGKQRSLPPIESRYKVQGYLDDIKPAITSIQEFKLVDEASYLFENASGCRLHRSPTSDKCTFLALSQWQGKLRQEDIPMTYLKLSQHLDFLGCLLYADYARTRRENGDILSEKITTQMNSWKSGKFLPLTSRPWSINQYSLSKLWYRTACIDLRVGDSRKISTSVKSWLSQDLLLKPSEVLCYRQTSDGGLGLLCLQVRAQAHLIHNFLQQAVNPRFTRNVYLHALYRFYILDEVSDKEPPRPPYYSLAFFSVIKEVRDRGQWNIIWMTLGQWYDPLLKINITHTITDPEDPPRLKPSRVEELHPDVCWERSHRLLGCNGLSPDHRSFLFLLKNDLLVTKERQYRLKKAPDPLCVYCHEEEGQTHLVTCNHNREVTQPLKDLLVLYMPGITDQQIVCLDWEVEGLAAELPLLWIGAVCLSFVWDRRKRDKSVNYRECRAELQGQWTLIKETKFRNEITVMEELLENFFPPN